MWEQMKDITNIHQSKGREGPMLSYETNGRLGHEGTGIGASLNLLLLVLQPDETLGGAEKVSAFC